MHRKPGMKVYEQNSEFEIGKGVMVRDGKEASILVSGALMMAQALKASELLHKEGISVRVVDLFSIKPIDKDIIIRCAKETKAIVVAENHFAIGGVASAVAEVLTENGLGVPFRNIGVKNSFGEVGPVDYLLERFNMADKDIVEAVKSTIQG